MRDARFYLIAGTGLVILATLLIMVLNLAGIDKSLITSVSVPTIGFLALLANDIRIASRAEARAEVVRAELKTSNAAIAAHVAEVSFRAEQVRATLEAAADAAARNAEVDRSELKASNAEVAALAARKFVDSAHLAEALNQMFVSSAEPRARESTHDRRGGGPSVRSE